MKKKFSLWINLAVICLCVCSIAIGVYAATTASLTVSGQIGFQAHDCEVEVSMTKMGYALTDTTYQQTAENIKMDDDNVGKVAGNGGEGTISTVALGELNFTDLAGSEIPNIVLTLTVTNKSAYQVAATVILEDVENLRYSREYNYGATAADSKTAHSGAVILNAKDDAENTSATFTITLKVDDPEENIEPLANNLQITANFAKYDQAALTAAGVVERNGVFYTFDASTNNSYYVQISEPGGKAVSGAVAIETFINGLPVTSFYGPGYYNVSGVTSVDLPTSITFIRQAAFDVFGITSIVMPNSVTSVGESSAIGHLVSASDTNTAIKSIKLSNALTTIPDGMFYHLAGLTSIDIPNSVISIGSGAFSGCTALETIKMGKGVSSITLTYGAYGSTFNDCKSLSSIEINSDNTKYDSRNSCNAIIETATNTLILGCKNSTVSDGIVKIADAAFAGCDLTEIVIPASVTTLGDQLFDSCTKLVSIIFEQEDCTKISMVVPFSNCSTSYIVYVPDDSVEEYSNHEYFAYLQLASKGRLKPISEKTSA